jgi:hypothetical protein
MSVKLGLLTNRRRSRRDIGENIVACEREKPGRKRNSPNEKLNIS